MTNDVTQEIMDKASDKSSELLTSAQGLWHRLLDYAPMIISAIGVLLGFWIAALLVSWVTRRLLKKTKLDKAVDNTRTGSILRAFNKDMTASRALSRLVYYALLLVGLTGAADILEMTSVRTILGQLLAYLPNLLFAVVIVAAGGYFAGILRRAVGSVLREMRSPYAKPLEGIVEASILVLVFMVAIDTLGVNLSFITSNLTLIVAAVLVTFCFLFALAMRKPAEEIIANYYLRRMVGVGDIIVLDDIEGTLEKFTAIGVMLRNKEGVLCFVPARHILNGLRHKGRGEIAKK